MKFWLTDSPPKILYASPVLERTSYTTYHVGVDASGILWYCWRDPVKGIYTGGNRIATLDTLASGAILIISNVNSSSQRVQIFERLTQSGSIFSYTLDRNYHSLVEATGMPFILKENPQYNLLASLFNGVV